MIRMGKESLPKKVFTYQPMNIRRRGRLCLKWIQGMEGAKRKENLIYFQDSAENTRQMRDAAGAVRPLLHIHTRAQRENSLL